MIKIKSKFIGANKYIVVLLTLILTLIIAYNTNGLNVTINLFYVSVVLSGRFWGIWGGIIVGIISGILGGPFLPDNIPNGVNQEVSQWVTRLCFYVFIGALVGWLFSTLEKRQNELLTQKKALEDYNKEILNKKKEIEENRDIINEQKENIKKFGVGIIESLAQAIEIRDSYTSGHCRRVSEMSVLIGERMGLDKQELIYLKWSAVLHDIGKIGIPENILNKEGKLTPYEMDIIKQHPMLGAKILEDIPYADRLLDGVLHHHERMDGKGYPHGLQGNEIGLQARIIAVSDVWDALTSKRPYRDAMSHEAALKIMESGVGSQFDPHVMEHFWEIVKFNYKIFKEEVYDNS